MVFSYSTEGYQVLTELDLRDLEVGLELLVDPLNLVQLFDAVKIGFEGGAYSSMSFCAFSMM